MNSNIVEDSIIYLNPRGLENDRRNNLDENNLDAYVRRNLAEGIRRRR